MEAFKLRLDREPNLPISPILHKDQGEAGVENDQNVNTNVIST